MPGYQEEIWRLEDVIRRLTVNVRDLTQRIEVLEKNKKQPGWDMRKDPCPHCKKFSRITTAGCDHCDYEDK